MREIEVIYSVRMRATIQVADDATNETIRDAISDIEIPEGPGGAYVEDTFDVVRVKENGLKIDISEDNTEEEAGFPFSKGFTGNEEGGVEDCVDR